MTQLRDIRIGLPTALALSVLVGAGAFAAGRGSASTTTIVTTSATPGEPAMEGESTLGAAADDLPPNHPALPASPALEPSTEQTAPEPGRATDETTTLRWKTPARWKEAPNANSMRLATYRIAAVSGDPQDAEATVTRAGGSVEANATRWIQQFDAEAQKRAHPTVVKKGSYDVTLVEVEGTYHGGMDGKTETGWGLLGAIVPVPGQPYFFKIVGPAKTVASAKRELMDLLASLSTATL